MKCISVNAISFNFSSIQKKNPNNNEHRTTNLVSEKKREGTRNPEQCQFPALTLLIINIVTLMTTA